MFRVLSNQQHQHLTNQKLRLWANAVFFKILGFACLRIADVLPVVASVPPFFGRTEATIGNTSAVRRLGVCGQAFLSSPSPSPIIPFFFALVPIFLDELARKRLLRRLGTWRPVGNAATTDYGAFHKRMTQKKVTGNGNMELLACRM